MPVLKTAMVARLASSAQRLAAAVPTAPTARLASPSTELTTLPALIALREVSPRLRVLPHAQTALQGSSPTLQV
jgi:hypothetical protein